MLLCKKLDAAYIILHAQTAIFNLFYNYYSIKKALFQESDLLSTATSCSEKFYHAAIIYPKPWKHWQQGTDELRISDGQFVIRCNANKQSLLQTPETRSPCPLAATREPFPIKPLCKHLFSF